MSITGDGDWDWGDSSSKPTLTQSNSYHQQLGEMNDNNWSGFDSSGYQSAYQQSKATEVGPVATSVKKNTNHQSCSQKLCEGFNSLDVKNVANKTTNNGKATEEDAAWDLLLN